MTFAVRTITRSATGGDIAHRPRRLETDTVVVGRGSDCDIRLADLAVSLRHARLTRTDPDQVVAEALGSQPFEADGTFTTRATLRPADKPRLVFGDHVLTLSASPDDDAVLVDVTARDVGPEAAAAFNENRIFRLGSRPFPKRPAAWALALLTLLACLAWPVAGYIAHANLTLHADRAWSSGPLSRSHAFLGNNCQACHVKAFVAVRDDACLACHRATSNPDAARLTAASLRAWGGRPPVALIREHADHERLLRATPLPRDPAGRVKALFERAFNHGEDRCASCHLEHLADAPPPGVAGATTASRLRATPALRVVDNCADCHAGLRRRLGSTALRDTPDWRHHPEFRPLIARTPIGSSRPILDRISLVQTPIDYTGLTFSHQAHLSTTGGVARMAAGLRVASGGLACANCHRPDPSGKGFRPIEMARDCSACHSLAFATGPDGQPRLLPHGRVDRLVATLRTFYGPAEAASRVRALFAPRGLCTECHAVAPPADPSTLDYRVGPVRLTDRFLPRGDFNHGVREHRLDGAGRPSCGACHRAADSTSARDVLLPRIAQCASCHGRTRAATPSAASADCVECHSFHAPGAATPRPDQGRPADDLAGVQLSGDGVSVTP